MNNSKAIKSLFTLQNDGEKLEIINEFGLSIDGFSNINIKKIAQHRDAIENRFNSIKNINNLEKKIKHELKNDENEFDYILEPKIIIDKYGHNFKKLLKVFYKDGYGELTEKLLDLLNEDEKDISGNLNINNYSKENEISKLRKIIEDLQNKVQTKDTKINELNKYKRSILNNIEELENKVKLKEKKINSLKKDIELLVDKMSENDKKVQNYIEELEKYKIENSNLKVENEEYKVYFKKKIHIIGIPKDLYSICNKLIRNYSSDESENFISSYNKRPEDTYYMFKPNVTTYVSRQVLKKTDVINIKNREELISIIKKADENE